MRLDDAHGRATSCAVTCAFAKLIRATDELQSYLQKAQADILAAIQVSKESTQDFTMEAWCTL